MSQSLNEISLEAFKLQLPILSSSQLKQLVQQIYDLKWKSKVITFDVTDIERKETAILKELQGRGYLTAADHKDFYAWMNKINYKKRSY